MKAVIFDMDGVISDTQKIHSRVESELLKGHGVDISPEELSVKYAGLSCRVLFTTEFSKRGIEADIDTVAEEKLKRMMALEDEDIAAVPGAGALIRGLKERGLKLGIASASRRAFVERVLSVTGLKEAFDAIATSEEVDRGKPDPDVFLLCARKLHVESWDCVVIEDGTSGMVAARRAGMKCIGLVREKDPTRYPADLLVESLEELTGERIQALYFDNLSGGSANTMRIG